MWKNSLCFYIFCGEINIDHQHKRDKIELEFKRSLTLRVAGTTNNKN